VFSIENSYNNFCSLPIVGSIISDSTYWVTFITFSMLFVKWISLGDIHMILSTESQRHVSNRFRHTSHEYYISRS